MMAKLLLKSRHRLVCGSCIDELAVDAALDGMRPDVCITDPPYGIGDTKSDKNNYKEYDDTNDNLLQLISTFFPIVQKRCQVIVLTPGNGNQSKYPTPRWTMAWFTPAGAGRGPWGFCCWQPILVYGKDPKLAKGKGCHPDAIVHTETAEKNGHPCPKPINFWKWLLERVSEPSQTVYEPFSGSGTTIIAGEMTGRRVFACELNPPYVDMAVDRWQRFSGGIAVLDGTGQTFDEVRVDRIAA